MKARRTKAARRMARDPSTVTADEFIRTLLPGECIGRLGKSFVLVSTPVLIDGERRWPPKVYQPGADYPQELYVDWATARAVDHVRRSGERVREPRATNAAFDAMHFLMLDDVGNAAKSCMTPTDSRVVAGTYLMETSAGNYQVGYAFAEPLTATQAARLRNACLASGLGDAGSLGQAHRWCRLPGSVNVKPGRKRFRSRLEWWNHQRSYSLEDLAALLDVNIEAPLVQPSKLRRQFRASGTAARSAANFLRMFDVLSAAGLYVESKARDGVHSVICPWVHEHSDNDESGTALFEPSAENNWVGGFRCHHGHCEKRQIGDVYRFARELDRAS